MSITSEKVVKIMIERGLTFTAMESCTGGLIASMVTDTEGASSIFKGSLVTYANEAKVKAGVPGAVIEEYGVYSAECARAMAAAACGNNVSDIAVGITGTTGNVDPNNADSVRGEVYYCIKAGAAFHEHHLALDVKGMGRGEIKKAYAESVFGSLLAVLEAGV